MRKIELWTEIDELNYQGEWSAVEVQPKQDVPSAGVFQLQQVSLTRSGITGRRGGVQLQQVNLTRSGITGVEIFSPSDYKNWHLML